MDNEYYSLTSILADNHKLACTFAQDVPGMGYLEGSEGDLRTGAKVELPLWLSQTLALNELVTFVVPPAFSQRVVSALKASAQSVRLAGFVGQGGWWYRFGARVASVWDSGDTLLTTLLKAFHARLPSLMDLAAHHASSDVSVPENGAVAGESFRDGMEADEREIFQIGQDSGRIVKAWYDSTWGKRGR